MALNQSAHHRLCRWDARKIALCVALTGIIAAVTPSQAQTPLDPAPAAFETPTPTPTPSPTPENADVLAAGNTIASDKPVAAGQTKADPWGPVPTKGVSLANSLPLFLPYFNNGPVFGLPGTVVGDFRDRTQLTGDWGAFEQSLLVVDTSSISTPLALIRTWRRVGSKPAAPSCKTLSFQSM